MITQEKVVLNPETFENVRLMLTSPDRENAVTALMALEQMEFKSCKMYMVLLYKDSSDKKDLWKENCPTVLKNIELLGLGEKISFKAIYNALKDVVSEEEMELYFDRWSKALTVLISDWGFKGMIEELDIKITRKK